MSVKVFPPQATSATLAAAMAASLVGDWAEVSDDRGYTGRVLFEIIGEDFEPYRRLKTIEDIAAEPAAVSVIAGDPAVLGEILERLVDYTMNHFIVEEELFNRLGYPEGEAHKAQHDRFSARVMDLLQRHEGGEGVGMEALELLKNWLTHHILKVDKAYVEHFRAHGVN